MENSEQNNHERFVSHFVRHSNSIHSFILTIVPSGVDADEILQDASLTMWQKFDQFQEGTNFRNWAFQVAKFTAMNHIRRVQRDRHVFTTQLVELLAKDFHMQSNELESRRAALRHCITKLNQKDNTVLLGCYSEKQSVKQFANLQGRTPNAVYKQLDRIRRDLLKCIRSVVGKLNPDPES
ncbi:MAG: sigma-70 family RNA polymerase sigma factor [Mariniblastus sp.]